MSAEIASLERYREGLSETVRDAGAQAALWDQDWTEEARAVLGDLARSGAIFTADDVRARVGPPPSDGALGAIFLSASRRRLIECVGFDRSRRVTRHGSVVRTWRGVRSERPPAATGEES